MFRQNKQGKFNVPFGKYKKPNIADKNNIIEVSSSLQGTEIICADFTECSKYAQKGSALIYFDPPYRPLSATANFNSYTKDGFSESDQIRLAKLCHELSNNGNHVLLSNSDPSNNNQADCYFEKIYNGFNIQQVLANRMINCNGSSRGQIRELLISNTNC